MVEYIRHGTRTPVSLTLQYLHTSLTSLPVIIPVSDIHTYVRTCMMVTETSLKRRLSADTDSEYEQDDNCDALVGSPLSNNSSDSGCFNMARKKRRGLIEKKRRDRINRSLNDLKNLIPTAHERQASAKLEKSEVLSLAVEHIKSLTARLECANPQNLAMDYRSIGYRECIGETISYLVHGEGLGPTNHLHTRLVSHLHQQLSVYDQSSLIPNRYSNNLPPTDTHPYSGQTYPEAVCKPEPPVSPSYCGAITNPATEYNNYPQYSTDCMRSSILPPSSEHSQWQPMSGCQDNSTGQLCSYAPQSSWV